MNPIAGFFLFCAGACFALGIVKTYPKPFGYEPRTLIITTTDDGKIAGYVFVSGHLKAGEVNAEVDRMNGVTGINAHAEVAWPMTGEIGQLFFPFHRP